MKNRKTYPFEHMLTNYLKMSELTDVIKQIEKYKPNSRGKYYIIKFKKVKGTKVHAIFTRGREKVKRAKPREEITTLDWYRQNVLDRKYKYLLRKGVGQQSHA